MLIVLLFVKQPILNNENYTILKFTLVWHTFTLADILSILIFSFFSTSLYLLLWFYPRQFSILPSFLQMWSVILDFPNSLGIVFLCFSSVILKEWPTLSLIFFSTLEWNIIIAVSCQTLQRGYLKSPWCYNIHKF